MFKLRAEQQQNPFPFVNKPFDIDIYLTDEQDHTKLGEDLKLSVTVSLDDNSPVPNQSKLLEIIENQGIQRNSGSARVVAKFLEASAAYDKKRFVLNFTASHTAFRIASSKSSAFYCVRYKLHVEEDNKSPYIWYKDEGGKDKCIEYRVSLRDSNNRILRDRKVPLKVKLNYVNGVEVSHQNILVLSPDSRLTIDDQGDGLLKVRIHEVSNRHRGQLFQVEISPDTVIFPGAADVAPILCMPVDVKSKRNKGSTGKTSRDDIPSLSSSMNMSSSSSLSYAEPTKKQRITGASAYGAPFAQSAVAQSNGYAMPSVSKRSHNPISSNHTSYSSNGAIDDGNMNIGLGFPGPTPANIGDAVNNIVNWTVRIMNGIETIQWREMGYEQNPDGSPNLSRPLFNIPNPNAVLHSISEQYRLSVMSSLQHLQQVAELERGSNGGIVDGNNDAGGNTPMDSDEETDVYMANQLRQNGRSASSRQHDLTLAISLDRGFSSFSTRSILEMPSNDRGNSLFLAGMDGIGSSMESGSPALPMPALIPSASSTWGMPTSIFDINSDFEAQVIYILAEHYKTSSITGLPAFNSLKEIIGLYQEGQGSTSGTVMRYIPISALIPSMPKAEQTLINSKLKVYLQQTPSNPRVFSVSANNRIEKIRDDAMIYLLEHE